MQNYNFIVLSPVKQSKFRSDGSQEALVSAENEKFKVTAEALKAANEDLAKSLDIPPTTGTRAAEKKTILKIEDREVNKQEYVLHIMVSIFLSHTLERTESESDRHAAKEHLEAHCCRNKNRDSKQISSQVAPDTEFQSHDPGPLPPSPLQQQDVRATNWLLQLQFQGH